MNHWKHFVLLIPKTLGSSVFNILVPKGVHADQETQQISYQTNRYSCYLGPWKSCMQR